MGQENSKHFNEKIILKDSLTLSFDQVRYICQQTNLVDREVHRRHIQFISVIKDGQMTEKQFTMVLQNIWPRGNVQKLANYLFNRCDKYRRGFIDATEFIIVHYHLNDDKSYLGFLFDMLDTRRKGYLLRDAIEPLFGLLFELIGHPTDEQNDVNISQMHIAHLIELIETNKNKRLLREHFVNIGNVEWIDEDNGAGALFIEQSC
ncbi:unnamed protein product [Adineta ricciae]|uniref:Uncharacterized protein n=1 Tax=Adineta ricciae TaxID=249248 RepID=A0A816A620_ADIRI|nr:unnamed protein product [Adineta ricciae]